MSQKDYLRKEYLEGFFSGRLQQIRVINYAREKKVSENYYLGSYLNFA